MKKRKKYIKTMDKVLILIGIFLFVFTCTMTFLIYKTGGSFDVLIERVFAACLGEGGFMGAIQIAKVIKGEWKKENYEESKETIIQ